MVGRTNLIGETPINPELIREIMKAVQPLMEKYPEDFLRLSQASPAELLEILRNTPVSAKKVDKI